MQFGLLDCFVVLLRGKLFEHVTYDYNIFINDFSNSFISKYILFGIDV